MTERAWSVQVIQTPRGPAMLMIRRVENPALNEVTFYTRVFLLRPAWLFAQL